MDRHEDIDDARGGIELTEWTETPERLLQEEVSQPNCLEGLKLAAIMLAAGMAIFLTMLDGSIIANAVRHPNSFPFAGLISKLPK